MESSGEAEALARKLVRDLESGDPSQVRGGHIAWKRKEFRERVVPAHYPIFERVLSGAGFGWGAEGLEDGPSVSGDELESAGVPRTTSRLPTIVGIVGAVLILGVAGWAIGSSIYNSTRPVIARLAVPQLGASASASVALKAGDELYFTVAADKLSWSGLNCVSIVIAATKGEQSVERMQCCGLRVTGSGRAFGRSQTREGCNMRIPAGGADGLWLSTRRANLDSDMTTEGVEVLVRR